MARAKIAIGVAAYGPQVQVWWASLVNLVAAFPQLDISFGGLVASGVSNTDVNRNSIAHFFINDTDAEWLLWLDTDNTPPPGAIKRLLDTGKMIVSGLYYSDVEGTITPIAYLRKPNGAYAQLDDIYQWERGEIVPVDGLGMGYCLTHRQVYLDIMENFVLLQRQGGGLIAIHKEDIRDKDIVDGTKHPYAGKLHKGIYYEPILPVQVFEPKFPFFLCQYGRTEDFWFWELVRRIGYNVYLDTSIEVGHVKPMALTGEDYRKFRMGITPEMSMVQDISYD